jgi:hypothetical protein
MNIYRSIDNIIDEIELIYKKNQLENGLPYRIRISIFELIILVHNNGDLSKKYRFELDL